MWVRSGFWIGSAKQGREAALRSAIDDRLLPAFRRVPLVSRVTALWPVRVDSGAPPIFCQLLLEFEKQEDIDRMRASPERAALNPLIEEIVAMFDGAVHHIDYLPGDTDPPKPAA